jgi:hypothetical protein
MGSGVILGHNVCQRQKNGTLEIKTIKQTLLSNMRRSP